MKRQFDDLVAEWKAELQKCSTCSNSHPSQAYPQLACLFRNEFVNPNDHCVRLVKK